MPYLLDSNIIIPYLADELETVPLVEGLAPFGISMSIVTYLETYQGTLRSPDPKGAQDKFEHLLEIVPILPLSLSVARRCARLREDLALQGKRVRNRVFDLVIAATALEHELQLVTRNHSDFADVPGLVLYQMT